MIAAASRESLEISNYYYVLVATFLEKWHDASTPFPSLMNMFYGIVNLINRIDTKLVLPTVRIHSNANLRRPEVINQCSSRRDIMKRLRRQINAVCQLADLAETGPGANTDERIALDTVKMELQQLLTESDGFVWALPPNQTTA